jgi:hypothetical protein
MKPVLSHQTVYSPGLTQENEFPQPDSPAEPAPSLVLEGGHGKPGASYTRMLSPEIGLSTASVTSAGKSGMLEVRRTVNSNSTPATIHPPATMECAVRSGYLAAEAVSRAAEKPSHFLQPDLAHTGFIRLLP